MPQLALVVFGECGYIGPLDHSTEHAVSQSIPDKEVPSGLSEGIAKCSVTCPMCGNRHVQYRLNPQLYWFTDMDIDLKPTGFHCRKSLEGYYPRLYELWHCPQCHFTAHNRVFPDPLKHVYIEKGLMARRLAEFKKSNPGMVRITETLAEGMSFENTNFPQAIRQSLLEIYYQRLIIDVLNQGHDQLARGFLRLAWLFRDWKEMQPDRAEEEKRLNGVLDLVSQDWPDCPRSENEALDAACKCFSLALERSKSPDPVESCGMMAHMARIRVKMGDLDAARQLLGECQRSIVTEVETISRAMTEDLHLGKLGEEERGRLLSDSRKLRSMLDECRALSDNIAKKNAESDRKRAEELISSNSKASPDAIRKLLGDNGISASIIRELLPERKGGLFGGLFK